MGVESAFLTAFGHIYDFSQVNEVAIKILLIFHIKNSMFMYDALYIMRIYFSIYQNEIIC